MFHKEKEIVNFAEGKEKERLLEELGIFVPVSNVVIQEEHVLHPDVERLAKFSFPEKGRFTWLTSVIELPDYLKTHIGYSIISELGIFSNLGVAIPLPKESASDQGELQEAFLPFFFFWNVFKEKARMRLKILDNVLIKRGERRLLEKEGEGGVKIFSEALKLADGQDSNIWRIGHGFVNNLVHHEVYRVGSVERESQYILFDRLSKGMLVSGVKTRGEKRILSPSLPFGQLRGTEEPLLAGRGVFKVMERVTDRLESRLESWLLGRQYSPSEVLERSKGFIGEEPFVF